MLNYPSRVSLYSVGRQVRVDLEGVAKGDSVLAGGARMAWRVGVNDTCSWQRPSPSSSQILRCAVVDGRTEVWLALAAMSSTRSPRC